jgi:hypothetical protein
MNYKTTLLTLFLINIISPVTAMNRLALDQKGNLLPTPQKPELYLESVKKRASESGIPSYLLHEAAEHGNTGALSYLLQDLKEKKRPDINSVLNRRTPLYAACQNNQYNTHIPAIKFLLDQPNIQPNTLCNGETILIYAARTRNNELFPLLFNNENIDIYKTNESGQTYLYCAIYDNVMIKTQDHFDMIKSIYLKGTEEEKQHFLNEQLFYAARMLRLDISTHPSSTVTDISGFLRLCVLWGADLNKRNKKGQRPVDVAEKLYYWATKTVHHKHLPIDRIVIYHSFLKEMPFLSDAFLWQILTSCCQSPDICKKILMIYIALTMERRIALWSQKEERLAEYHKYCLASPLDQENIIQLTLDDIYKQYRFTS